MMGGEMTDFEKIRERNRQAYREEQDLPKVKWAAFQEQRRREDIAALRFAAKQAKLKHKLANPDPVVTTFIHKLQRFLRRRMKESGGTEGSVLRQAFLNWDADCSGELSSTEFMGALRSLGCLISQREAQIVVDYYDLEGDGEMTYPPLVEDVSRGSRHFLQHPEKESARPSASDHSDSARPHRKNPHGDDFMSAFLQKLRKILMKHMRRYGENEKILVRRAFLNWDADASGCISAAELKGAMNQLGMFINNTEAARIVDFYDVYKKGEFGYKTLVDDVSNGVPTFMEHPESEGKSHLDVPDEDDMAVAGRMFTARPTQRSDNALVERFKRSLTQCLEDKMIREGGTIASIMREAFLFWDSDSSGALDVAEFKGAINRVGLALSNAEASQVVRYYASNNRPPLGQDEIMYEEIVTDVCRHSRNFLSHSMTIRKPEPVRTARIPSEVVQILRKVVDGVLKCSQKSAMTISPRDLLHGTLLRVDIQNKGKLDAKQMQKVFREMRISSITLNDVGRLVNWYDDDASKTMDYAKFVKDTIRELGTANASGLPPLKGGPSVPIKRTAILAEKARIERRLKDLSKSEELTKTKMR